MRHRITFYTDDEKVESIHDIKVSFYDQKRRAYSISVKQGANEKKVVSVEDIVNKRLAELNKPSK